MFCLGVTVTMTIGLVLAHQVTMTSTLQTSTPSPMNGSVTFQLSSKNLFPVLCEVTECFTEEDIMDNSEFWNSRKITNRKESSISNLKVQLELRRLDIVKCCHTKSRRLSVQCLKDIRRRRIDYLCANNTTQGLPFTSLRRAFMTEKSKQCCYKLGSHRYKCFNENSRSDTTSLNKAFSLDETDPINDIWDYSVNTTWIEKMARSMSERYGEDLMSQLRSQTNRTEQSRYQRRRHLSQADDHDSGSGQQPASDQQSPLETSLHASGSVTVSVHGSSRTNLSRRHKQTTPSHPHVNTVTITPQYGGSEDGATGRHFSETTVGLPTTQKERQTGRHPGAILHIYRSKVRRTTITSVETSPRVTQTSPRAVDEVPQHAIPPMGSDIAASLRERWWVRSPETLRMKPHHYQAQVTDKNSMGISGFEKRNPSLSGGIGIPGSQARKGIIQRTVLRGKKSRSSNSLSISRKYPKTSHARKGKGKRRRKVKTKVIKNGHGKRERYNDRLEKAECRFSVLNVDDFQEGHQNLIQILKKIYKNDVWD